jgi:GT2 family glycosyltransferase
LNAAPADVEVNPEDTCSDATSRLRVAVVVVTYGDRWHLLSKVLQELMTYQQVCDIVVIDNDSTYDLLDRVKAAALDHVKVVSMGENSGSAGGYAAGIQEAYNTTKADLIWLLDDDNRPRGRCLQRLLLTYAALGCDPSNLLLCLRRNRRDQSLALAGERQMRVKPNSFLGFHLSELPQKMRRHAFRSSPIDAHWRNTIVAVWIAPYGGLLFHRSWVERAGLPDARFYLYGDDHEYTSRIAAAGGTISLVGYCKIEDLEESWINQGSGVVALVSSSSSRARVFYSTRNRVYLEWRRFVSNRAFYFANIVAYLAMLMVWALVRERAPLQLFARIKLITEAIVAGVRGQLGKRPQGKIQ